MNETYRLELTFVDQLGKTKKVTVRKPIEGLTETEILPVMEVIAENDIFSDDGFDPYEQVKSARYVRTSIEELFEA